MEIKIGKPNNTNPITDWTLNDAVTIRCCARDKNSQLQIQTQNESMISIWIDLIQWASSNIIHTEARSNNNNNRERDKNNRPGFISINLGRNAIHKRTRARVYSLSRENFTLLPAFFFSILDSMGFGWKYTHPKAHYLCIYRLLIEFI